MSALRRSKAESEQLATSTLAEIDPKSDPDDFGWLKLHLGKIRFERKELAPALQLLEEASAVLATATASAEDSSTTIYRPGMRRVLRRTVPSPLNAAVATRAIPANRTAVLLMVQRIVRAHCRAGG